ncbi:unnamed protein product [Rotaria sp. Silwood1]|nr:unnamed protein product [Rotaria sp. Silwood1]
MTEQEDLTIEKSSVIAVLNENGSYWLAKVINVEDENKNIEIQYFDDNTFRIENTSTQIVQQPSIFCTFGRIHHSCKQFKLSDVLQAKLVKQVAEARQLLTNSTNNNLSQQVDRIQELQDINATLKIEIEHYKNPYCIMAQVADSLLMNLYLNESDDDDHRPSKTTSSIISLMENGVIHDDAVISLLLSHHRQPDKIQQQQAVCILANLCFNRLTTFRAFDEQIKTKKKEDIIEFMQLFCLEFSKLTLSFEGEKDWKFAQIFIKIQMEMLKQD